MKSLSLINTARILYKDLADLLPEQYLGQEATLEVPNTGAWLGT
jgi:hypothetical protein